MPQNEKPDFEVCVESAQGLGACSGLVDRIELCSALDIGGLTPSAGLMDLARESGLETHVLIRPSSGDFEMSATDLKVAILDIQRARSIGLDGVVIGATKEGLLDLSALRSLIEAAEDMTLTLHRAFDVVADQLKALEQAIDLGFHTILTSGAAKTAPEGTKQLRKLTEQSQSRIEIMAGGGVTAETVNDLIAKTNVHAIHASCSARVPQRADHVEKGFGEFARKTDRKTVESMLSRVKA